MNVAGKSPSSAWTRAKDIGTAASVIPVMANECSRDNRTIKPRGLEEKETNVLTWGPEDVTERAFVSSASV